MRKGLKEVDDTMLVDSRTYEKYKSSAIMHQILDNLYKYLTVNFSDQEIPGNRYSSELTQHNV